MSDLVKVFDRSDFDAAVEQALALVREDTATVIDIATKVVIL